jgi:hypothetical protein
VDGHQAQLAGPGVDECVRLPRRAYYHVATLDDDSLVSNPECGLARLDHKYLGVRVAMELGSNTGLCMHKDDAEGNVTVLSADEFVRVVGVLEVIVGDDRSRWSVLLGQGSPSGWRINLDCAGRRSARLDRSVESGCGTVGR